MGPAAQIGAWWQAIAARPGDAPTWHSLARCYAELGLHWQAGYSARQARRLAPTIPLGELAQAPDDAVLGREHWPEAAAVAQQFARTLGEQPGDWLTWLYLARLAEMAGLPGHPQALPTAQALEPLPGESLHWMGVWRLQAGDAAGAIDALRGLLDIRPVRCGSMMFLGDALLRTGQVAAAEKAFSRASLSDNPAFLLTLAARVYGLNYWQEAIAVLHKAIGLAADARPALLLLARIQSEVYALADCRQTLARLFALDAHNAEGRLLEAGLQGRLGDARAHLHLLQRAYESGGDPRSRIASSIAMTALYDDTLTPADVAGLHRRLCAPIEEVVSAKRSFANPLQPDRRLRVGFVTGDLHRQHPVSLFMLPLLMRLDHSRLHVGVYHGGALHDECTRQARAHADRWVEAAALDDPALQQIIVADGVDILVDLAGHSATHRLGVFAMRAAPVQASFLGYPHSTGLSAIDWLIGDPTVSPVAHAALFSEGLAQLPHSVFCWAPVDTHPVPPPRPAEAPPVLGSFNNAMKLSPATIALWSAVLRALPSARLLLKAPSLHDESVCSSLTTKFADHGIAGDRLAFRGPSGLDAMMQEYGDIDIALDPVPYNGGTTSLQALWMGVPVVTLAGGNFAGRMGASLLSTLGHPEWVAADESGYVCAVARLAGGLPALRSGRERLRADVAGSALGAIALYARHFERLLRRMWQLHCSGDTRRIIPVEEVTA